MRNCTVFLFIDKDLFMTTLYAMKPNIIILLTISVLIQPDETLIVSMNGRTFDCVLLFLYNLPYFFLLSLLFPCINLIILSYRAYVPTILKTSMSVFPKIKSLPLPEYQGVVSHHLHLKRFIKRDSFVILRV